MFFFKRKENNPVINFAEYQRLQGCIKDLKKYNRKLKNTPELKYSYPPITMLKDYPSEVSEDAPISAVLEAKLKEFGIKGTVVNVKRGPIITRYEIQLGEGVSLEKVRRRVEDISVALMGSIRILAPIPGTALVGIELANKSQSIIGLKSILNSYKKGSAKIPFALGTDTVGQPKILDLTEMPHLLISGTTGSGKSVSINSLILSILYTMKPEECQLILVDPKRVEMTPYKGMPHVKNLITEPEEALNMFRRLIEIMDNRYNTFSEARVRNINGYNEDGIKMPYIVVVVDEMSDLMMQSGKALEGLIIRIAQMGRAAGIHLVLATQKPVVKVITGLIKSNIATRISFKVSSSLDSRIILDSNGAERLIGRGDMLVAGISSEGLERFHGAFVTDKEIFAVTDSIRGKYEPVFS